MEKKQEGLAASAESNGMIEGITWRGLSDAERGEITETIKSVMERSSGNYKLLCVQPLMLTNHAPCPCPCPAAPHHQADIDLGMAIQGTEADHNSTPFKVVRWGRFLYAFIRGSMKREDIQRVLPLSSKDLVANTEPKQEDLNLKDFMRSTFGSMLDIPPKYHGVLLLLCGGFLSYQAKTMTEPFNHQFGKSTSTPQIVQMNFKEAFFAFFPEMTHITKFILCYSLSWVLVLSLHNGVLICLVLLLISAPLFYFPELVRKASASGIDVACGFVKLPLIWFTSLGALVISLICALLALVAVYLIWKFVNEGRPNDNDVEDGLDLDSLSSVMLGG